MSKRKADIFTVAESVTNWFEASGYTVASPEWPKGVVTNQHGPISEESTPPNSGPCGTIEPIAGWATGNPYTWLSATGSGPADFADWTEDGQGGMCPVEPINQVEDGPLGQGPADAANWTQVQPANREPTGGAEEGDLYPVDTTGNPPAADVAKREGLSQHPFWALLMAAGYEEI